MAEKQEGHSLTKEECAPKQDPFQHEPAKLIVSREKPRNWVIQECAEREGVLLDAQGGLIPDTARQSQSSSQSPTLRRQSRSSASFSRASAELGEPNSPSKGGHTLRRKPRVNYALEAEQMGDGPMVPNSTSSSRLKIRDNHGEVEISRLKQQQHGALVEQECKHEPEKHTCSDLCEPKKGRPQRMSCKRAISILSMLSEPNERYEIYGDTYRELHGDRRLFSEYRPYTINYQKLIKPASGGCFYVTWFGIEDQKLSNMDLNQRSTLMRLAVEPTITKGFCEADVPPWALGRVSRREELPGLEWNSIEPKEYGFPWGEVDALPQDHPVEPGSASESAIETFTPTPIDSALAGSSGDGSRAATSNSTNTSTNAKQRPAAAPERDEKLLGSKRSSPSHSQTNEQQGVEEAEGGENKPQIESEHRTKKESPDAQIASPQPSEIQRVPSSSDSALSTDLSDEHIRSQLGSLKWCAEQPRPPSPWSHLTPYVWGEYSVYPEQKNQPQEEDAASDEQSPEEKESGKDSGIDLDAVADDMLDAQGPPTELATPTLNTPTRGSPVLDAGELTSFNSPAIATDEVDSNDISESQEAVVAKLKHYKLRKIQDVDVFLNAAEDYQDKSNEELLTLAYALTDCMNTWQEEYAEEQRRVDDCENAERRRLADNKYEARTKDLGQEGINWEEPDFQVKGYKARAKEAVLTETRYLQAQDRIMASAYGFEYDPHPSKIGKQNPEMQQAGISTRGRSLRNQPKPTVKATETEGVTGKRQRKPVQLFEPAAHDASRAATPVPTSGRGRRRKNADADIVDGGGEPSSSFNGGNHSDAETPGTGRRKRAARTRVRNDDADSMIQDERYEALKPAAARRNRGKVAIRAEHQSSVRVSKADGRFLITFLLPQSDKHRRPSLPLSDNGESRPSTADSGVTVESSYSFRPNRKKRFRTALEDNPESATAPPRKRVRKAGPDVGDRDEYMETVIPLPAPDLSQQSHASKPPKIKMRRGSNGPSPETRTGTPTSQPTTEGGDDSSKEYRAMTKSEKMSASMKNRWANGNMAGAVEKRKATLAAKKLQQAAAEQRVGPLAPKPKGKPAKKIDQVSLPGENPAFMHSRPVSQPPPPAHQHHEMHQPMHHQLPPPPPQQQQQQQPQHHHHQPLPQQQYAVQPPPHHVQQGIPPHYPPEYASGHPLGHHQHAVHGRPTHAPPPGMHPAQAQQGLPPGYRPFGHHEYAPYRG
ncbi:uncharacterized protein J7T54_008431 [Emericellopsis cladophorae]|uniref:Uncharacterized protein n=1 Tax=Emericellopsis cladophorae TaxID=2686198 RepID=A0A9Q0BF58_9HYPO|nr:uncharacterized protein J7T54_008431 [Emericellopsis cladophorae]KAI6782345.1 hypothetical protein J7T54_008431 [Emericellopsis cladophorae]